MRFVRWVIGDQSFDRLVIVREVSCGKLKGDGNVCTDNFWSVVSLVPCHNQRVFCQGEFEGSDGLPYRPKIPHTHSVIQRGGKEMEGGNGEREADSGKWRERDKGIDEGATHQGPSEEVLSV
jgi:hypothetical protein